MIEINSKIGIVCCSNGQSKNYEDKINKLLNKMVELKLTNDICARCNYRVKDMD